MPLAVCATPIGNLDDVTLRVLEELRAADLILCEDTRHTRVLLERHGLTGKRLLSCNVIGEMANFYQRKLTPGDKCTALISLRFHVPPSHIFCPFYLFFAVDLWGKSTAIFLNSIPEFPASRKPY